MKIAIFLLVLVSCQVQGLVSPPWLGHRSLARTQEYGCKVGKPGLSCKDCNTIVYCDVDGTALMPIECSKYSTNAKATFCDLETQQCVEKNTCTVEGSNAGSLDCKFPGFFADPMSCSRYFFCEKETGKAASYNCPSNTKFDPIKKICISSTVCKTYSPETNGLCAGKTLQAMAMPDGSTYVICPPKGEATQIFSCGSPLEKYDAASHSCKFVCPSEGFFKHAEKVKINMCVKEGAGMKIYEVNCAAGTEFDETKGFCYTKTG